MLRLSLTGSQPCCKGTGGWQEKNAGAVPTLTRVLPKLEIRCLYRHSERVGKVGEREDSSIGREELTQKRERESLAERSWADICILPR